MIVQGCALDILKTLEASSVDSIVTDPPYFLLNSSGKGFMNKEWDGLSIQHVIAEIFFKSASVELSMAGESIAQENASINTVEQIIESTLDVQSVQKNLDETNPRSNQPINSVQASVLTKAEALVLCKEWSPSLIKALEKLPDNVSFVLQPLPIGITINGTVQNAVDIYLYEPRWLEKITTFISMDNPNSLKNSTEGESGIGSELAFTKEICGVVDDVANIAVEQTSNVTTSDLTVFQKTIQKIISLPFVKAVIKQFTKNQNFTQNILISWHERWAREAIRVLKPGGHILAFSGSRTSQYLTLGLERAGFEIRDQIIWIYGSGFPKSLAVDKALKKMGKENEAKSWAGFGTALKPSHEPICLGRKPLSEDTIAEKVLKHGTGALNIDASRMSGPSWGSRINSPGQVYSNYPQVKTESNTQGRFPSNLLLSHHPDCEEVCSEDCAVMGLGDPARFFYVAKASKKDRGQGVERLITWENQDQNLVGQMEHLCQQLRDILGDMMQNPSELLWNIESFGSNITDQCHMVIKYTIEIMSKLTTELRTSKFLQPSNIKDFIRDADSLMMDRGLNHALCVENLNQLRLNTTSAKTGSLLDASLVLLESKKNIISLGRRGNIHSTVKNTKLMEYLITLITPPGGIVLDMFAGSGSTLVAAKRLGFQFIGIEKEQEYFDIAKHRIS
jgi:DNA modification methylase